MDSIGDILYIVFIIAIGLFQWYRKQKQKEARRGQQSPGPTAGPAKEKNTWDDIFGEILSGEEGEGKKVPEEKLEAGEYETNKSRKNHEAELKRLELESLIKRREDLWGNTENMEVKEIEEEKSSLEFDLRKAVIYEAIMEPKFKEI